MRRGIVTVGALAALVVAGAASAGMTTGPVAPVGNDSGSGIVNAKALLSTSVAGAPVAMTLRLHGELQCGRPQGRAFVVHLPAGMTVPATIARGGVRLGGLVPLRVAVNDHAVSITAPLPRGAICNVLGPGWFSIAFGQDAGLRNPAAAGSYGFTVSGRLGGRWNGTLTVS